VSYSFSPPWRRSGAQPEPLPGTLAWFSPVWRFLASHCRSLLRRLCWWSVRVLFASTALLYVLCSMLSDAEYALGLRTHDLRHFILAARLFPLERSHRSGAGYTVNLIGDRAHIGLIREAISHDPNAADLWYDLARMELLTGNQTGYNEALDRLKRLTPQHSYQIAVVQEGAKP
jgi:hypothetical protein